MISDLYRALLPELEFHPGEITYTLKLLITTGEIKRF